MAKAQLLDNDNGSISDCQLFEDAVNCLNGNSWLDDEVIYAFLLYVTRNTNHIVIDPLVIKMPATFTIPGYPIKDQVCYVPLHMCGGTHWGLAVCNIFSSTVTIYDSYAKRYAYSAAAFRRNEPSLWKIWKQITDVPLHHVEVAGSDFVHEQNDGFSCGVFTCIYGERLAMGLPTKTEAPTCSFLQHARKRIEGCLRSSFTVTDNITSGMASLPRVFNHPTQYTLIFVENSPTTTATVNHSSTSVTPAESQSLKPLFDEFQIQEDFSVQQLLLLHHVAFCKCRNILHVMTCLKKASVDTYFTVLPLSKGYDTIVVIFYVSHNGHASAALFRYVLKRPRAIVFEPYSSVLCESTRKHLLNVAESFGFVRSTLRLHKHYFSQANAASAISLCIFNCIKGVSVTKDTVSSSLVEEHCKRLWEAFAMIPDRYAQYEMETSLSRMSDDHYIAKEAHEFLQASLGIQMILRPTQLSVTNEKSPSKDQHEENTTTNTVASIHTPISAKIWENGIKEQFLTMNQNRRDFSVQQLLILHHVTFSKCPNVYHVMTSLEKTFADICLTAALPSLGFDTILVVFYVSYSGYISAAVFRYILKRPRAIVFEPHSPILSASTREHIQSIGESFGFVRSTLRLSKQRYSKTHTAGTVSLCIFECIRSTNVSKETVTSVHVEQHCKQLWDALALIPNCYTHKELDTTLTWMRCDHHSVDKAYEFLQTSLEIRYLPLLSKQIEVDKSLCSSKKELSSPFYLGPMNVCCQHCSAVLFRGEPKSLCCNGGRIIVPEHVLSQKKDAALEWLWQRAWRDRRIYSMLRAINNLVAFGGVGMNIRKFKKAAGPAPLVVQGTIDVGICHLNPNSSTASFAQLYVCDDYKSKRAINESMQQWKTKIDYKFIERIISTLRERNVIAKAYKSMYEVYLNEMEALRIEGQDVPPQILMNLKNRRDAPDVVPSSIHEGRLNVPQIDNQIAAIYVCRNGIFPSEEELDEGLRIYSRGGKRIAAHHNNNIDALSYPLYFPNGEQTFVHNKIPKRAGKRHASGSSNTVSTFVNTEASQFNEDSCEDDAIDPSSSKFLSRSDFYRFVLSRRGDLLEHRFYGSGRLLSQFVIHVFTRIEADFLSSIGRNMCETRSCKATAFYTYLDQRLQEKGFKLGKLINLPSKFIGSRGWFDKLYHNAMAVAHRVGKPDLFITFTGNQEWPEICENLATRFDTWITDPLLCARVFKMRLQSLINEIIDEQIFGEVVALQYSIEFQKRGMPHAHILVTLREKVNTPEKIDAYISAEIPEYPSADDDDAEAKLKLFDLVSRFMVHNPCKFRPHLACRSANADFCDKHFPKPYRDATDLTNDGYPLYRRRKNGRTAPIGKRKTRVASNEDIIPYNAHLLLKYQCHINVECCCSIMAFKYIFKYIYKGPDQIIFELSRSNPSQSTGPVQCRNDSVDIDMRRAFLDGRYLSNVEAAYRLFHFPMQYNTHSVISLTAHLPGEESVYLQGPRMRRLQPTSKLLAYFALVESDPQAKNLTWIEVAERYRFKGNKYVLYEKGRRRIARIWPVNPKMSELYALRKLLINVRGASSYQFLRTVNGIVYDTFMQAAVAAGYIQAETEWEECLRTAATTQMPYSIRGLYAQILLYCHPTNPVHLWNLFRAEMRTRSRETKESDSMLDLLSIRHIKTILLANGSSLEGCGLGQIEKDLVCECGTNAVNCGISPEVPTPSYPVMKPLTAMQERIVNVILEASRLPKGTGNKLYFIDGKAGCGKTHTLNTLIVLLEAEGKRVMATASTGIAATLLKHGRTAHSLFCLPVKKLHSGSTANVDASSPVGQELNKVDVIIWDEISMQSRFALECVEKLLRDVASSSVADSLFGGVTVVLGGDWCQFLPVIQGGTRQETIDSTCKSSDLWSHFITFILDANLRVSEEEQDFARWLLLVGAGRNFDDDDNILLPPSMCLTSENEVIDWIYTPELMNDLQKLSRAALLTVRNCDAEALNIKVLNRLPGTAIDFIGIDIPTIEEDGFNGLPCDNEEYFHTLMPASLPPYILRIKEGSIIMLLRNIDVSSQLCNGTRLIVVSIMSEKLLRCVNLINGQNAFIHRMDLDYTNEKTGVSFRRVQFPIRLSFCMTINKSQGQTFDKLGIILRTPSFAHGSTYVALSRCTSRDGIRITRNWTDSVPLTPKIRNVVYEEMFDL